MFQIRFGVLYSVVSLPTAHMIDRGNRIYMLCAGVSLWGLTTVASAFAPSFTELAVCRAGVAVGEAVLSPAAISLIADFLPRERRASPTASFTAMSTMMSSGAFVLGGWAFAAATRLSPYYDMPPWRITLILVGIPGLVLPLLILCTVREPARRDDHDADVYASVGSAIAYVRRELRLYSFVFAGLGAYTIAAYACIAWIPTLLIRKFAVTPSNAGYMFGVVGVTLGIFGAMLWPWLVTRLAERGRPQSLITILAYILGIASASLGLLGIAPNLPLALVAAGLLILCGSSASCLPPLLIQYVAPGSMRARLMAGYLLLTTMIGLAIGPGAAAAIAAFIFRSRCVRSGFCYNRALHRPRNIRRT